jgi:acetyl esterase/lipase
MRIHVAQIKLRTRPKQILINPALDLTCGGSLEYDNSVVDLLRWCVKAYVSSEEDIFHPYVSPLIADDVAGAAPALLVLAEQDPLCSGGTLFGQKLIDAGVDAEVFIQKGVGHLSGDWSAATKRAEPSLEVVVESLLKLG